MPASGSALRHTGANATHTCMKRLDTCGLCGDGQLAGLCQRPGSTNVNHRHYRCLSWDCKGYTNCLQGLRFLPDQKRWRTLTPARIFLMLVSFTSKLSATRQDLQQFGVWDKQAQKVADALRHLEMKAALRQMTRMRLRGAIEVDASALRCFRVGRNSQAWAPEIRRWLKEHPFAKKPRYFVGHLRVAGALERGEHGRLMMRALPVRLLSPGHLCVAWFMCGTKKVRKWDSNLLRSARK